MKAGVARSFLAFLCISSVSKDTPLDCYIIVRTRSVCFGRTAEFEADNRSQKDQRVWRPIRRASKQVIITTR
jgi:hypothetical protein